MARQEKEAAEAHRIFDQRAQDAQNHHLGVPNNFEWDGVRRRVSWSGGPDGHPRRRNTTATAHLPLGLARIPDIEEGANEDSGISRRTSQLDRTRRRSLSVDAGMAPGGVYRGFSNEDLNPEEFQSIWQKTKSLFVPKTRSQRSLKSSHSNDTHDADKADTFPLPTAGLQRPATSAEGRDSSALGAPSSSRAYLYQPSPNYTIHRDWAYNASGSGQYRSDVSPVYGMDPHLKPATQDCSSSIISDKSGLGPESRKQPGRQFSFQNIFSRAHRRNESAESAHSAARKVSGPRKISKSPSEECFTMVESRTPSEKTEEEMLGLVKGDKSSTREGSIPYRDTPSDSESDDEKAKDADVMHTVKRIPTDATTSDDADDEKSSGIGGSSGYGGSSSSGSTIRIV